MFEIIVLLLVVQVIGIIFMDSKVSNIQGLLEGRREEMQKKSNGQTTVTVQGVCPAGYEPSIPRPPSKP